MPGSSGDALKIFQFDQCFNDASIADACNARGLTKAFRFPKKLMGKDDAEVLDELLIKQNTVVTTDINMVRDHVDHVPDNHPGIIAICNGHANPQTITSSIIKKILFEFKLKFPGWYSANLSNSVAEITPVGIDIFHVERGELIRDQYIAFDQPGWALQVDAILARNAARTKGLGASPDGY